MPPGGSSGTFECPALSSVPSRLSSKLGQGQCSTVGFQAVLAHEFGAYHTPAASPLLTRHMDREMALARLNVQLLLHF